MNARTIFAAVAFALSLPALAASGAADQAVRPQTPFKQAPMVRLPALPTQAAVEVTHVRQTPFKQAAMIPARTLVNPVATTRSEDVLRGHIALKQLTQS